MREKIIIALDFDNIEAAKKCVTDLPEAIFFKVGLEAYIKYGNEIIEFLKTHNKKLFLDLKFKDIPNTVYGAVNSALKYEPDFLTIHLSGGGKMIRKALEAAHPSQLTILGVTILTSLSETDMSETGSAFSIKDSVLKLCQLGVQNGLNAFVCSPQEIELLRSQVGSEITLITPGIRPEWAATNDQKRVFTPKMAISAGSNFLVIGRPITKHPQPSKAFQMILDELHI